MTLIFTPTNLRILLATCDDVDCQMAADWVADNESHVYTVHSRNYVKNWIMGIGTMLCEDVDVIFEKMQLLGYSISRPIIALATLETLDVMFECSLFLTVVRAYYPQYLNEIRKFATFTHWLEHRLGTGARDLQLVIVQKITPKAREVARHVTFEILSQ